MSTCISATTETLQCLNTPQRSNNKPNPFTNKNLNLQQQTPLDYNAFPATQNFQNSINDDYGLEGLIAQSMKLEPSLESCYDNDLGSIIGGNFWVYGNILSGFNTNTSIARTLNSPQPADSVAVKKGKEIIESEKLRSNFNKRKSDKTRNQKEAKEDENKEKKLKNFMNKDQNNSTKNSTTTEYNKEASDITKEKSKIYQVQKTDYIHVRARRGQATDSHSLAERVRREKISDKMKYLQNLVPGCNNITGKAGMLDEIINYVRALQYQVEFLSMKLAVLYPEPDFNDNSYYMKEVPEICLRQNYWSDVLHHAGSSNGKEIGVDLSVALRRITDAPLVSIFESPSFNYPQSCSNFESELQSIVGLEFQQTRSTLPYQLTTDFSGGGPCEDGDVTSNNKYTSFDNIQCASGYM